MLRLVVEQKGATDEANCCTGPNHFDLTMDVKILLRLRNAEPLCPWSLENQGAFFLEVKVP